MFYNHMNDKLSQMNIGIVKTVFLLVVFGLVIASCQQEVTEIIEPTDNNAFNTNSSISDLAQRTSTNDGSADNIIDGASCVELVLPVTVKANGVEITVNSEEDFSEIEKILDRFEDDDDKVEIMFPIKIILPDYTEISINDEDELEDYTEDCVDDGSDDDIECVDFKYPLEISIYNAENQVSDVLTINSDRQLYDFIDDLDDDEIASFNFPITIILSDGSEMNIKNHDELEDALESAIDDCDEDDDNDYNDDDVDDSDLIDVLLDGEWVISYFYDEEDETDVFEGYVFTFYESGEVKAKKGDEVVDGEWQSDGDDGSLELDLDFDDDSLLDDLDDDWDVIEYNENQIDLSEDDSSSERLVFKKK